jgi:hypothetical protein
MEILGSIKPSTVWWATKILNTANSSATTKPMLLAVRTWWPRSMGLASWSNFCADIVKAMFSPLVLGTLL